jgi:hypothetical protein
MGIDVPQTSRYPLPRSQRRIPRAWYRPVIGARSVTCSGPASAAESWAWTETGIAPTAESRSASARTAPGRRRGDRLIVAALDMAMRARLTSPEHLVARS